MPDESGSTAVAGVAAAERPNASDPRSGNPVDQNDRRVPMREIGGPKGLEPTRFGDWERAGRCVDF
jgi:hypothetical protein